MNYVKGEGLWNRLDDVSKPLIEEVALDAWEIKRCSINYLDPHHH